MPKITAYGFAPKPQPSGLPIGLVAVVGLLVTAAFAGGFFLGRQTGPKSPAAGPSTAEQLRQVGFPVGLATDAEIRQNLPHLPALIEGMASPSAEIRSLSAQAAAVLGEKYGQPAVPALTRALADPDKAVRFAAANSLGVIRPPDKAVADALGKLATSDPDPDVRASAAGALRLLAGK